VNDVNDHAGQWERSRDHRQLATRSRIRDHRHCVKVISVPLRICPSPCTCSAHALVCVWFESDWTY